MTVRFSSRRLMMPVAGLVALTVLVAFAVATGLPAWLTNLAAAGGGCTTSWTDGSSATSYGYDDAGNRTQLGAATLTYDARDELLTDTATGTYTYTPRGTLASQVTPSQQTLATSSDALGQVITQDATNGSQATYAYDGLGRLVAPGLAYTGLANTVAADGVAIYNRDPGGGLYATTQGGVSRLDWTDQHDDVVGQYSASAAALTGSATYNPLGITLAGSGLVGNLGYQSELTDTATGRVNMMARWYDPDTGQFDNPDTLAQSSVPHSVDANRHAYVADNPLRYTDPTGHTISAASLNYGTPSESPLGPPLPPPPPPPPAPPVASKDLSGSDCMDLPPQRIVQCQAAAALTLKEAQDQADRHDAYIASDARLVCKSVDGTRQCLSQADWDAGKPRIVTLPGNRTIVLYPDGGGIQYQVLPPTPPAPPQKPECHGFWGCVGSFVQDHAGEIVGGIVGVALGAACTGFSWGLGVVGCAVLAGVVGGAIANLITGLQQGKTGWNLATDVVVGAVIGGVAGLIGGGLGKVVLGSLVKEGAGLGARMLGGAIAGAVGGAPAGAFAGAASATYTYATTCGTSCNFLDGLKTAGKAAGQGAIAGAAFGAAFGALGGIKGCANSFTPTTKVLMADGSTKPIADIQLGDQVKATDPHTNQTHPEPVTHLYLNHDHQFTTITIKQPDQPTTTTAPPTSTTGARPGPVQQAILTLTAAVALATGATATIHTTQEHPFWDTTTHTWVNAAQLTTGDTLRTDTGQTIHILAVTNTTSTRDMYNLTIDQIHTYYVLAGSTPVLVHNCNAGPPSRFEVDSNGVATDLRPGLVEGPAPQQAYDMLAMVDGRPNGLGKVPGYGGNRNYANKSGALPSGVKYREWELYPENSLPCPRGCGGTAPGPERVVTGVDGSAYYTPDHYGTFFRLR